MATVFIALCNLGFIFFHFFYNKKKDEKSAKVDWFKQIVVIPRLEEINSFFREVANITKSLKKKDLIQSDKIQIINQIKLEASTLRMSFIEQLRPVNEKLFMNIQQALDQMVDEITVAVDNPGINLYVEEMYERKVANVIRRTRTAFIREIMSYRGI